MIPRRNIVFSCIALVLLIVVLLISASYRDISSAPSSSVAASSPSNQPSEAPGQVPLLVTPASTRAVATEKRDRHDSSEPPSLSASRQASRNNSALLAQVLQQNGWKQHPSVPLPMSQDGVWTPTRCLEYSKMRGMCLFWSEGRFSPPLDAKKIRAEARELMALKRSRRKAGGSSFSASGKKSSSSSIFSAGFAAAVAKECTFEQLQSGGSRMSFAGKAGGGGGVRHKDKCGLVTPTRNDLLVSWTAASMRINERSVVDDYARKQAEEEDGESTANAGDDENDARRSSSRQQPRQLQPYPKLLFRADSLGRNKASNFVSAIRDWPFNLDRGHHGLHLYVVTTHRDFWFFRDSSFRHAHAWRVPIDKLWRTGSANCDFPMHKISSSSTSSSSSSSLIHLNKSAGEEILLVVQYCSHLGVERPIAVPRPLSQWTSVHVGTCCWDHGFHRLERYVGFFTSALLLSERLPAGSFLFFDGWSTGGGGDKQSPMRGQRIQAKRIAYQAFSRLVTERGRATVVFNDAGALAERARASGIVPLDDAGHFSCIIRPHCEVALGTMPLAGKEKWLANPHVKGLESWEVGTRAVERCSDPFNRALLQIYSTYARSMLPVDKPIQRWAQEEALVGVVGGHPHRKKKKNQIASAWMDAAGSVSADLGPARMELEQLQPHLLSAADIYYAWRLSSSLSNIFFTLMLGATPAGASPAPGATSDAAAQKFARSIAGNMTFVCEMHPALLRSQQRHGGTSPPPLGDPAGRVRTIAEACLRVEEAFEKDALSLLSLAESWTRSSSPSSGITEKMLRKKVFPVISSTCAETFDRVGIAVVYVHACQRLSEIFAAVPLKRNFEATLLGMTVDDLRMRLASWRVMGMLQRMEI